MIDYYTARTMFGNSRKVGIMFAETGLEHVVHFVDLERGDQNAPSFLAINPNGRIPAIIDHDVEADLALGESGAILIYLADKCGHFLPSSGRRRAETLQWLFWQTSGIGPIFGQWQYFEQGAPEKIPRAIARYRTEAVRLLDVLDTRLATREHVAGDYSIADMAIYPWVAPAFSLIQAAAPDMTAKWPNIARWIDTIATRPAVRIAMSSHEGSATRIAD